MALFAGGAFAEAAPASTSGQNTTNGAAVEGTGKVRAAAHPVGSTHVIRVATRGKDLRPEQVVAVFRVGQPGLRPLALGEVLDADGTTATIITNRSLPLHGSYAFKVLDKTRHHGVIEDSDW